MVHAPARVAARVPEVQVKTVMHTRVYHMPHSLKCARVFLAIIAISMGFLFPAPPAEAAELRAPKVGTHMIWDCTGPYSQRYDLTVVKIENGIARYEGTLDGQPYFAEKDIKLTGTSLWVRLLGDRAQWFDMEDFAGFYKLKPGSRYKGAVPARQGEDKWVWDFEARVGQPQVVTHDVLGKVTLVPVTENRKIFHGTYWSRMTTFLLPERGISVRWIYEDPKGVESCDLVKLEP